MSKGPDLEELLSQNNSEKQEPNSSLKDKVLDHVRYFVADGVSNVLYYAPIMTVTERLSGMDWEKIGTSRSIGALTAFLTGYAYNSFLRKRLAKTVGANTQSSWVKRKFVDITVGMATTAPFYAPMLYVAGASSKEMALALFFGSMAGAAAGGLYGHVADKWRAFWELDPVLNK